MGDWNSKVMACNDSSFQGIECLESECRYGFFKDNNDMRPSSCTWILKEKAEKLYKLFNGKGWHEGFKSANESKDEFCMENEHKNDVENIFMKKKLPDRTEENKEYKKNHSFNTRSMKEVENEIINK